MNVIAVNQSGGLSNIISQLQNERRTIMESYIEAISKGEKLNEVRTLFITLKDVEKRLSYLASICM